MTALANLAHLDQHGTARDTWPEYRALIEDHITNQPRSQQVALGPSQIGVTCDRCLVHALAGHQQKQTGTPWLPFIGTSVHEQLADIFLAQNSGLDRARFLVETRVDCGIYAGRTLTGHADLYDMETGAVTDWKIVGTATLRKAKAHGAITSYRVQAHLYGYGFTRRGLTVNTVQVAHLPRNSAHLGDAITWSEPYDEQVALDALTRAHRLATVLDALGVDAALTAVGDHTGDEYGCTRYGDIAVQASTTSSLINA